MTTQTDISVLSPRRGRGRPKKPCNGGQINIEQLSSATHIIPCADSLEQEACVCPCNQKLANLHSKFTNLDSKYTDLISKFNDLCEKYHELAKAVASPGPTKDEKYYQRLTEKLLNGKHMLIRSVGITDVTNDFEHAEIKKWSQYHHAVGQLLSYNNAVPRSKLSVYFYGPQPAPEKIGFVLEFCRKNGVHIYSFDKDDDAITEHFVIDPREGLTNVVNNFVKEKMMRDENSMVSWVDLFSEFKKYHNRPVTAKNVSVDELRGALTKLGFGFVDTDIRPAKNVVVKFRGYKGWRLRDPVAPDPKPEN